jgi:Na+/proline symporter
MQTPGNLPFLLAIGLAAGSLLFYFSGAFLSRLTASEESDIVGFNLDVPSGQNMQDLFAVSLVSAGTSLSTVFSFFLTNAWRFGIGLLICPALFALGNWVMFLLYRRGKALGYFEEGSTPENRGSSGLLPYLGEILSGSKAVGYFLKFIVSLNLLALIVLELTFGIKILSYLTQGLPLAQVTGNGVQFAVFGFFVILLLGYVFIGGFRAVVASDVWQYKVIKLAILVTLVSLLAYPFSSRPPQFNWHPLLTPDPRALFGFILNASIVNLFGPLSLEPSWQRFRAFRGRTELRQAVRSSIQRSFLLWSGLIAIAMTLQAMAPKHLDNIAVVLEFVRSLRSPWFPMFVFPILTAAALSAFYSTSDTSVSALLYLGEYSRQGKVMRDRKGLPASYYANMLVILTVTVMVYAVVTILEVNSLSLVFAVFSSLVIIAPTVMLTARLRPYDARLVGPSRSAHVLASLASGFVAFWAWALFGFITRNELIVASAILPGLLAAGIPAFVLLQKERNIERKVESPCYMKNS